MTRSCGIPGCTVEPRFKGDAMCHRHIGEFTREEVNDLRARKGLPHVKGGDGFRIGVHDPRDPLLLRVGPNDPRDPNGAIWSAQQELAAIHAEFGHLGRPLKSACSCKAWPCGCRCHLDDEAQP